MLVATDRADWNPLSRQQFSQQDLYDWGTVVEAAAQHLSIGSLFPSYQIMKCRIQISVKLLIWIVFIGPSITSCDMSMLSFSSIPGIAIHNNLFRYGMYCGPGPDDKLWAVTQPVDSIDQTCQDHDKAYRKCLRNLSKDTGMHHTRLDTIVSRIGLELSIPSRMSFSSKHLWTRICISGFAMPKILHQIMPIRGFVPSMISRAMFSIAPRYISCMHHADKNLVSNFDHFVDAGLLPSWWTKPEEAPVGTQGIAGIRWLLRHHRIDKVVMMFNYFIRWMKWYLRDSKILRVKSISVCALWSSFWFYYIYWWLI